MHGFEMLLSFADDVIRFLTGPTSYGIAVWFLALIFAWSGTVKLHHPERAARAIADFEVVREVRPAFGFALGTMELLLALSLVFAWQLHLSLLAVTLLLWFFTLLIARSLRHGKQFACFCFGDEDSQLSRLILIRSVALAVLASTLYLTGILTDTSKSLGASDELQAVTALSILGTIMLIAHVPSLFRWNDDLLQAQSRNKGK